MRNFRFNISLLCQESSRCRNESSHGTYNLRVPVEGSEVERGAAVAVGVVDARAALQQRLHAVQVALETRPAQRRQTLLVAQCHGRAWQ